VKGRSGGQTDLIFQKKNPRWQGTQSDSREKKPARGARAKRGFFTRRNFLNQTTRYQRTKKTDPGSKRRHQEETPGGPLRGGLYDPMATPTWERQKKGLRRTKALGEQHQPLNKGLSGLLLIGFVIVGVQVNLRRKD